ncbi:Ni,Fe-hydrogenase III large subunit [Thermus arciformis]|uniref:Ni,Fe-hydrogenase III large subunit n=1 Tax=Thermus arciformis TaxID=482827 RepID=A0A1G7H1J4_9DEIN|nr:hydrogenase-4 subunit G [Thermus arciformis]SDE94194.1 Ni,Fe-hydrogenase III large subunit [Thermus arciformis]
MDAVKEALREGRPVALFPDGGQAVLVVEVGRALRVFRLGEGGSFPSLASDFPSLDWFERALWERGYTPVGHPGPKPLRRHDLPYAFREFPELHEVPVGPVHAGIIEPGHFRFSVLGERILHLEIRLGYQHRGLLNRLLGKGPEAALLLAERAGSEPVAHALAFALAWEEALGRKAPPRAQALRLAALELERAFGHLGHLAGLFTDIGYAYGATQVGRVRALLQGEVDRLTGHRYGRNFVRVGGVWREGRPDLAALAAYREELSRLLPRLLKHPQVLDRMRYVGVVRRVEAEAYGFVGPTARASGVARDLRQEDPAYPGFRPVVRQGGDVLSRAQVYAEEALQALDYALGFLAHLPEGPLAQDLPPGDGEAMARVEAGRGEVFWFVRLEGGKVALAEGVDPSFKNWRALELAVRGEGLPDFPLCNKSFDLSYAGTDL